MRRHGKAPAAPEAGQADEMQVADQSRVENSTPSSRQSPSQCSDRSTKDAGYPSRLAGYEDVNDAVRVPADPTFRLIGSKSHWGRGAALTSTLRGFETEMLASEENLLGLMAVAFGCTESLESDVKRPRLLAADDARRFLSTSRHCWNLSLRGPEHSHPGARAGPCR